MEASELTDRVVRAGAIGVAAVAALAGAVAGPWEAVGVVAGGVVAFGSFRWLVRDAGRLVSAGAADVRRRLLPVGLRQLTAFAVLTALIGGGLSHPLALVAGLALLPPVLVVQGLRAARR